MIRVLCNFWARCREWAVVASDYYMGSSLNSFPRIRTKITFIAYLQDSAFKTQLSQQTSNMSEKKNMNHWFASKLLQTYSSAALLAWAAGATGNTNYHTLRGSFIWSNNADSRVHIPVAATSWKQTVLLRFQIRWVDQRAAAFFWGSYLARI